MTKGMAFRAAVIWLVIVCFAVSNGILRENILAPRLGETFALPLSGLTLSIIVFVVAYFSFNFIGAKASTTCIFIGIQWVLMTLAFEFIFGLFVADKSWSELLQVFNIARGNLFLLVLVVTLISPSIVAKTKGAS
jgi:membrane protease YdiL (CAAX protease family)